MNIQNYIQKQLQEVVETAPGTAIVNVVVTKFYGLTETTAPFPLTHCKLSMAKPNLSCVEIVDNSVMVTRKGAPVSFQYRKRAKRNPMSARNPRRLPGRNFRRMPCTSMEAACSSRTAIAPTPISWDTDSA
jgi:hypothetical protein